jgi:hypothetical protein
MSVTDIYWENRDMVRIAIGVGVVLLVQTLLVLWAGAADRHHRSGSVDDRP